MQMETQSIILSRLLPKTNQSVSDGGGDDGYYQTGWWKGKTVANNRVRFIDKTIAGDAIVKDLATGLMWIKDGNSEGNGYGNSFTWQNAIDIMTTFSIGGFINWRLPNILELLSILDFAKSSTPYTYSIFTNTVSDVHWTSTTLGKDALKAWAVYFNSEFMAPATKTANMRLRAVRTI